MKAKHIKKLRKHIDTFDKFLIRESASLFGDFCGNNRLGLVMDNYYVTADSHELALQRFFRKYERMFKHRNDKYITQPVETTMQWGRVMVKNQRTKFIKFYK